MYRIYTQFPKVNGLMIFKDDYNQYIWRDNTWNPGFGPFKTLEECFNHHSTVIYKSQPQLKLVPQPPGTVINVDFKSRKRI
jgi:hypothetical protein